MTISRKLSINCKKKNNSVSLLPKSLTFLTVTSWVQLWILCLGMAIERSFPKWEHFSGVSYRICYQLLRNMLDCCLDTDSRILGQTKRPFGPLSSGISWGQLDHHWESKCGPQNGKGSALSVYQWFHSRKDLVEFLKWDIPINFHPHMWKVEKYFSS